MERKPIQIVGGGLSGLMMGILLQRESVPVEIIEAGRYPRHRVCGEFINGAGLDVLKRHGILPHLDEIGARPARSVKFFLNGRPSPVFQLPRPALCISRFKLDQALADLFVEAGGSLRQGQRWTSDFHGEGLIRATGRRRGKESSGIHYLGLKAHATDVSMEADLEMHFQADGYCGLCKISETEVNICALIRRTELLPDLATQWPGLLSGLVEATRNYGSIAWIPSSFCSTAGLFFESSPSTAQAEFRTGDSISMIPPLTGNGMSIAFESAELLHPVISSYGKGEISWQNALKEGQRSSKTQFSGRFRRAWWLQRLMWTGFGVEFLGALSQSRELFGFLFAKLR